MKEEMSRSDKVRYYPRMRAEFLLAYRPLSARKKETKITKTKTIGLGGLMFESDQPLLLGALYHLELVVEEHKIETKGRVVYTNRLTPALYQNGIEFTEISDSDREFLLSCYMKEEYKIDPNSQ